MNITYQCSIVVSTSSGIFLQGLEEATKLGSKLLNNEVYYSYIQTFTCSLKDSTGWLTKRKRVRQWSALILARYTKLFTRNNVQHEKPRCRRRYRKCGKLFSTWETNIQGRKIYCLYIYKRRYERDTPSLISSPFFLFLLLYSPLFSFFFFYIHIYD